MLEVFRLLAPPGVASSLIRYGDKVFYETDGYLADSSIFDILTYQFIEGSPSTALREANAVVITEALSIKLFGDDHALDKIISISMGSEAVDVKVNGVIRDKFNSFVHVNFMMSMTSNGWGDYLRSDQANGEWAGQNFVPAYVKLAPGHNKQAVVDKMNEVLVKYGAEDMKALGIQKSLLLEPVKDIYLKSDIGQNPRIQYLYVIASIAGFILLLACINFMNLATARATHRANEIGIRKVMGAFRSSLISQLLGEALVIVLFAIVLGVVLLQAALPVFNNLTDRHITLSSANAGYFALATAAITLVTGLLAGSYPAFYLSAFQPAQVLKGKSTISNRKGWLRQSLVVFQFVIAIVLVCGMIMINRQLSFMQEKNLGFDAEAKIVIPLRTASARDSYAALKNQYLQNAFVEKVSAAFYTPGSRIFNDMMFYKDGQDMNKAILNFRNTVDYDYLSTLNIKLLAGRNFTANREADVDTKLIINKTSAERFGFTPAEAIGQKLYFDWQQQQYAFEIIGVMDDFHQQSVKEKIEPTMFQLAGDETSFDYLIASVRPGQFSESVDALRAQWNTTVIDTPFEYTFLDDKVQKQYDNDRKVSGIITSFTVIAMFISCLGLYGLSSYMAERRFKEIGIRKVMGASINQILQLMSSEFLKLVLIAIVLAVPVAWYGMSRWLEGFAYRVSIEVTLFIYAGAAALVVALLTVSFESLRAAATNPVRALRNE